MFGILITDGRRNYSVLNSDNEIIATTMGSMFTNGKLCPKNCRTVACGYDFDKSVEYFDKGKMYIQQDGVIVLAGENRTDGIVAKDPLGSRGVGYYAVDWNPKAFNEYDSDLKVIETLSDNKFGEEDMILFFKWAYQQAITEGGDETSVELLQKWKSLQQTEWEVEVEMEKVKDETKTIASERGVKGSGHKITTYKSVPKLDVNGCLILKRK